MIIIVAVLVSAFSFVQVGAKIPNRVPVQTVGTLQCACLACVMHIIMTIYFIISRSRTLTLKLTFTSPLHTAQHNLMNRWESIALRDSESAEERVLQYFNSAQFRKSLGRCCRGIANSTSAELLRRFQAEVRAAGSHAALALTLTLTLTLPQAPPKNVN